MAFDFPASPAEGQVFSPPAGPTYVFNTPVWRALGQGQIASIGDSFPANPANGQLHWDSDTGRLFIFYNDGNSAQWVQISGTQVPSGVVKIFDFEVTTAAQQFTFALPTSGYSMLELLVSRFDVTTATAASISFDWSWDGGATFPNVAAQYQYIQHSYNTAAAGAPLVQGGVTTNNWLIWGIANGSGLKGQARALMPVVAVSQLASMTSESWAYTASEYRFHRGASFSNASAGPPNFGRLRTSTATIAIGSRWQLNGIR